jgi:hypothetical protein
MGRKAKSTEAAAAALSRTPPQLAPSSTTAAPAAAAASAPAAAAAASSAVDTADADADEEDDEEDDEDEDEGAAGAGAGAPGAKAKPGRAQAWDALSYKQLLDESLTGALEEGARLEEDSSYSNAKLAVMAVASLSALVAQFYPLPFPENRALLGACVLVYFGLSGVYQVMASFLDRDYVFAARARRGAGAGAGAGGASAVRRPPVVLRSMMEKHSDVYRAVVECPSGREVARLECSVGAYFTARGAFAERAFERTVRRELLPALVALDPSVVAEAEKAREEAAGAKEAAEAAAKGEGLAAAAKEGAAAAAGADAGAAGKLRPSAS